MRFESGDLRFESGDTIETIVTIVTTVTIVFLLFYFFFLDAFCLVLDELARLLTHRNPI